MPAVQSKSLRGLVVDEEGVAGECVAGRCRPSAGRAVEQQVGAVVVTAPASLKLLLVTLAVPPLVRRMPMPLS